MAEVKSLKSQVDTEREMRTAAEERAESIAAASFAVCTSEEQPTGKTVLVRVCTNPTERDTKKQKWTEIEIPTYFYLIQLPAGASGSNGSCLTTNGVEYHNGEVVELDACQLADVKSRVARTWDHEKSIHGENENAYRKPTNKHLISQAAALRGAH